MTTENTEPMFVKRDDWEPGPWDAEQDRYEWRDERTGLPCLIVRNGYGALCGYVGVPPGHVLHGKGYGEIDGTDDGGPHDVHGGLTFAGSCRGHICHVPAPGEPDAVWWLGFDCNHSGDRAPGAAAADRKMGFSDLFDGFGRSYRTVGYVRAEVTKLASACANATTADLRKVEVSE